MADNFFSDLAKMIQLGVKTAQNPFATVNPNDPLEKWGMDFYDKYANPTQKAVEVNARGNIPAPKPSNTYQNNWIPKKNWDYSNGIPTSSNVPLPNPPAPPVETTGINAVMQPVVPENNNPFSGVINNANMGNIEQAQMQSKRFPDLTPLPQNTGTELTDAQIAENPYKKNTTAYIIHNLQQHGYNPEQIANYLELEQKKNLKSPSVELESLLTNEYNDVSNRSSYNWNPQRAYELATQLYELRTKKPEGSISALDKAKLDIENKKLTGNTQEFGDWVVNLDKGFAINKVTGEMRGAPKSGANANGKPLTVSELSTLKDSQNALLRMKSLAETYSGKDKGALFGVGGLIERGINDKFSGTTSARANQYNQDIGMLKRGIAKAYEGGRMSDQDRVYYDKTLFNPNVSQQDFITALSKYEKFLESDYNNAIQVYSDAGRDVSGFTSENMDETSDNELEAEMKRRGLL